jgi:ferritin
MTPKQFFVFLIPLSITSGSIMIKARVFPNSILFNILAIVVCLAAWKFYLDVGRNKEALYNLELRLRFLFSILQGEETIQKYDSKDRQKVKNFTRIKKVLDGGYMEFEPVETANNWGGIIEVDAYAPMDMEVFTRNAERLLTSVPDGTIIKTIMAARNKVHNAADPFKRELKKEKLHPIVRDQLYELVEMCEKAEFKTYKTHIFISIPYITDKKKACNLLNNVLDSTVKMLEEMGIKGTRMMNENEVTNVFTELITHNQITRGNINS